MMEVLALKRRPKPDGYQPTHSVMVSRIGNFLPISTHFRCCAVMMERGGHCGMGESPDVFGVQPNGDSFLIECKISRRDFLADQKKLWRLLPKSALGKYRFYAAPAGMLDPDELPEGWGLLEVTKNHIRFVAPSAVHEQDAQGMRKEIGFMSRAIRDVKCGVIIVPNNPGKEEA